MTLKRLRLRVPVPPRYSPEALRLCATASAAGYELCPEVAEEVWRAHGDHIQIPWPLMLNRTNEELLNIILQFCTEE